MSLRTLDPLSKCGGVSAWEWVLSVVTTQWCNTDMSPWQCHFCRFTKSSELLPQRHSPPIVSMEVQRMNHRRVPCNQVSTFWWVLQAGSWITWPEAVLTYQNWGQLVELLYSRDVSEGNYVWSFIAFIAQISIFIAYTIFIVTSLKPTSVRFTELFISQLASKAAFLVSCFIGFTEP